MSSPPTRRVRKTPSDVTVEFAYRLDPASSPRPGLAAGAPDPTPVRVTLVAPDGTEYTKRRTVRGRSGTARVSFSITNLDELEMVRTIVTIEDGNTAKAEALVPRAPRQARLIHLELTGRRGDGAPTDQGVLYDFTAVVQGERGDAPASGSCVLETDGAQPASIALPARGGDDDGEEIEQLQIPLGSARVMPGATVRAQARLESGKGEVLHDGFEVPDEPAELAYFNIIGAVQRAATEQEPAFWRIQTQVQARGWTRGKLSGTVDLGGGAKAFDVTVRAPGATGEQTVVFDDVPVYAGEIIEGVCQLDNGARLEDAFDSGVPVSSGQLGLALEAIGNNVFALIASVSAELTARGAQTVEISLEGASGGWSRTVEGGRLDASGIRLGQVAGSEEGERTVTATLLIDGRTVARVTETIPQVAAREPEPEVEPEVEDEATAEAPPIPIPAPPSATSVADAERDAQAEDDAERREREREEAEREALQLSVELIDPADGVVGPGSNEITIRVVTGDARPRGALRINVSVEDVQGEPSTALEAGLAATTVVTDAEGLARFVYECPAIDFTPTVQPLVSVAVTTDEIEVQADAFR